MDLIVVKNRDEQTLEMSRLCRNCEAKCERGFIYSQYFDVITCRDRDIKIEMKGE